MSEYSSNSLVYMIRVYIAVEMHKQLPFRSTNWNSKMHKWSRILPRTGVSYKDKFRHYLKGHTHAEMYSCTLKWLCSWTPVGNSVRKTPAQPCITFIQTLDAPMLDIRVLRCVCLSVSISPEQCTRPTFTKFPCILPMAVRFGCPLPALRLVMYFRFMDDVMFAHNGQE